MVSLKANVSDLEEEKKSLLMVIKVLQTDADLNQPESKENRNGWQNGKGRAASEKQVETFSASKSDTRRNDRGHETSHQTMPREIILHVGTNDLAKKNPQEIVNSIADIVNIIHVESPETKPVLSEIMRTDSSSYIPKIGKIKQQLQSYCRDQNIDLIQHGNLQAKHLNSYGVHLNRAGNSILAKNLIGYFNKGSGN
ncbi:Zinc finger MYM-type 1 [Paramuricea clavata]|uniref:Zinc finger MYM-type 1 n=1 Tax=Paramuricea clavata TaxID=317549 RepID=A0A6S7H7I6_PARCT|nr:Zinc finger MYM-type 1 [Paramuricea clavata]